MQTIKKIFPYSFIILLLACNDKYLDVAPRDQLSSASFWRNSDDARKASVGVYDAWSSAHSYQIAFADDWSDNSIPSGFWQAFYYYIWGSGSISAAQGDLNNYWSSIYTVVRRANVFLTNIDKPVMDETERKVLTGEVRFLRAFEYFLLYYSWGEVPIVDKPLDLAALKVGRGKSGETVKFLLDDLDYAIANLPIRQAETGRITRGAALALKSRVLLYEGRWQDAAATAKLVMDLNTYQLHRNGKPDAYKQVFAPENENNKEVILDWQFLAPDRQNDLPGWFNPLSNFLLSPTQSLVDSYETYNKATDKLVAVDPKNTFMNRDPRLDFTIAHKGSVINGIILDPSKTPLNSNATGYGVTKYSIDDYNLVGVNHILLRYSEILLTYAEAKMEANQIDQSVLDALNEIRSRAYGVVKTEIGSYPEITTLDQTTLRTIIRNERRVELAMEGLRWYDIKRWKILPQTMNGPVYGFEGVKAGERNLQERNYLRPIPQSQIDLVGKEILIQNPNY